MDSEYAAFSVLLKEMKWGDCGSSSRRGLLGLCTQQCCWGRKEQLDSRDTQDWQGLDVVDGEEGGIEKDPVFLTWGTERVAECLNKIKSLRRSCFENHLQTQQCSWNHRPFMLSASLLPLEVAFFRLSSPPSPISFPLGKSLALPPWQKLSALVGSYQVSDLEISLEGNEIPWARRGLPALHTHTL